VRVPRSIFLLVVARVDSFHTCINRESGVTVEKSPLHSLWERQPYPGSMSVIACLRQLSCRRLRLTLISEHMNLPLWKWVVWWGSIGLLVPIALILRWKFLGAMFGQIELILWPSSILLIGLEGQHSAVSIIMAYAMVIVANIALYCVIGLLARPVLLLALRRRGPI